LHLRCGAPSVLVRNMTVVLLTYLSRFRGEGALMVSDGPHAAVGSCPHPSAMSLVIHKPPDVNFAIGLPVTPHPMEREG
jgi:hypothetical protein